MKQTKIGRTRLASCFVASYAPPSTYLFVRLGSVLGCFAHLIQTRTSYKKLRKKPLSKISQNISFASMRMDRRKATVFGAEETSRLQDRGPAGRHTEGFTLIETLIYIALLAFIMGGGVVAAFSLVDSAEQEKTRIETIVEAEFLLRKTDWMLTGVESINSPAAGTSGASLSLDKNGFASNPLVLDAAGERARLSRGGGAAQELTGDRVKIENLNFEHIAAAPPKPAAIKASFAANGRYFEMTKYLRK